MLKVNTGSAVILFSSEWNCCGRETFDMTTFIGIEADTPVFKVIWTDAPIFKSAQVFASIG